MGLPRVDDCIVANRWETTRPNTRSHGRGLVPMVFGGRTVSEVCSGERTSKKCGVRLVRFGPSSVVLR